MESREASGKTPRISTNKTRMVCQRVCTHGKDELDESRWYGQLLLRISDLQTSRGKEYRTLRISNGFCFSSPLPIINLKH
jgi:hypothetical protein